MRERLESTLSTSHISLTLLVSSLLTSLAFLRHNSTSSTFLEIALTTSQDLYINLLYSPSLYLPPSLYLTPSHSCLLNVLLCRFINASRWPRSTVPFHKQFAASYLSFLHTFLSQYACDRCRYRYTWRCRYRYKHGCRATLYGHMRWQTTMRHISNYINVYLKNYTSDLREREEQPSMTSGKYTKVSRYMCSCSCICSCVCVCQAMPYK